MNRINLLGRLGKDPETRHISDTASVTQASLATSEKYTNKNGEKVEETEWHRLIIWNKAGLNFEKYLSKGSEVLIEGKIKTRKYDDKDGITRYATEIIVDRWHFTGGSKVETQQEQWAPPEQPLNQPNSDQSEPYNDLPW